jgi:hypothetical protein
VLLKRSADFVPWLAPTVLAAGLVVAVGLLAARRRVAAVLAGAGLVVALAGPAAYAVDTAATAHTGSIPSAGPAVTGPGGGPGGGGFRGGAADGQVTQGGTAAGGPGGGLLNASTAGSEMVALLQADADDYTWAAATVGSNNASGYQLATGQPVMAIGGFNGTDPSPTLARFQQYVAAGRSTTSSPAAPAAAPRPAAASRHRRSPTGSRRTSPPPPPAA